MSDPLTVDSIRALLRFPFRHEGWQQAFLIGSALILVGFVIPIVPLVFVAGYAARVIAQAVAGEDPRLPRWEDWGSLGRDGLRITGVSLVYTLPGGIVFVGGLLVYLMASLLTPVLFAASGDSALSGVLIFAGTLGGMVLLFVFMAAAWLLMLAGYVPLPLAIAHAVAEDRFAAAFRIRDWRRLLRQDRLGYFVAWVLLAGLVAMLYTGLMLAYYSMILCPLVPFITAPLTLYLSVVSAALFGRIYRQMRAAAETESS